MDRLRRVTLAAWPVLVAAVVLLPLLVRPGYPLARDLVFVPRQPWTEAVLGLGGAAPRAVPLDALVSAATVLVDGGVLARVVLLLVLASAGWGAQRLVADLGTTARVVAGGLAIWNPFVVERLALGQWALLTAYAALPWLAVSARRHREEGRMVDLASVLLWVALSSVTPTGGLVAAAAALVLGLGGRARAALLVSTVALLQLPWVLPALLGTAGLTSDPDGVAAFAARGEGPGGPVVAVLGLGGIWDAGSVPGSRETWWGTVTAVLLVAALVAAGRHLWDRPGARRFGALAAGGLVLALLGSVPLADDLLRWAVEHVPGAGLLRDGQKLALPYAVLVVAAVATVVDRVVARTREWGSEVSAATAVLAVATPVLLLPDATGAVWPTVDPVEPTRDLAAVAERVDGSGATLATLPWRSYRRFDWGGDLVSSDPAVRWFDTDVLVADDLQVGETTVAGESRRAADLGRALEEGPPAEALAAEGVGWVLVYRDDPDADALDLTGLEERYSGPDLALYAVPDARSPAADEQPVRTAVVVGGDLLAAGLVLAAGVLRVASRKVRRT